MRFGAHLRVSRHSPWEEYYCDYDALKALIAAKCSTEQFIEAWTQQLSKIDAFFHKKWRELLDLLYSKAGRAEGLELVVECLSVDELEDMRRSDALLMTLHSFVEDNFAALRKSVKKFDKTSL
eukprot:GSA25T00017474001.1